METERYVKIPASLYDRLIFLFFGLVKYEETEKEVEKHKEKQVQKIVQPIRTQVQKTVVVEDEEIVVKKIPFFEGLKKTEDSNME